MDRAPRQSVLIELAFFVSFVWHAYHNQSMGSLVVAALFVVALYTRMRRESVLAADARRYRFLRDQAGPSWESWLASCADYRAGRGKPFGDPLTPGQADAEIDAALSKDQVHG